MRPERWQQLDQLFHSALEREPSARAAFLDDACGGDYSLHQQVAALLAGHEEAGSFIEEPAFEVEARAVAEDHNQLSTGQTIGHYQIVSLLGAGGMGEVYLAEDMTLGRKVALKLLPADFSRDTDRVRRFQQEARAASALNHPNIVTVHEIAHVGDRDLIATEFIDGETLRERIRGVRSRTTEGDGDKSGTWVPLREVLNIGIQIADALSAAHEAGIVHRDIKPENIMVRRRDGYIKVLDFGLAKLTPVGFGDGVDGEAATRPRVKTSAGMVMGTVTYMSPEQTRGEVVDQRTDLWSLGVVLYELIAGCAPFERPSQSEVIAAILDHDPPPLTDYVREIPCELERIISKALSKDRESRYQTAKELLVDLRHLQHCWEAEKEIDWSSSPKARDTQPTGTNPLAIGRALNSQYLLRAIVNHKAALFIAVLAIILVIAAVIYRSYFTRGGQTIDSIAVLPLVNASDDLNTEYLSDGISEALINNLSELQQLRVIARATAFRYKGKDVDPQAVGRDLKVRAVLMGRMRQTGDMLNIQVDLVDVATGAQLWGQAYERKVSNVLSIKQSIALELTHKLRLGLSGEQQQHLNKSDTRNAEAYEFYLRGRQFLNKGTVEGFKKAITQFEQAIEKDPNYARAWAGLAETYDLLEVAGSRPTSETLPKGRTAAERALQIDDSLTEAHTSLAIIEERSWNFTAAEREFRRAIELDPNNPRARQFYGFYLGWVRGRFDEAMAELRQAQQFDPISPSIGNNVAQVYVAKGDLDEAIKQEKMVLELDPYPTAHRILALIYRKQGRYDDAFAELEKAIELSGRESRFLADLGVCYAVAGQRDKARGVLKELEEQYDRRKTLAQHVADVYAALGDKDQAFAWLEKDFQTRSGALSIIAYAPRSDVLRAALSTDPRWNDLLRRIGLPQN